MRRKKKKNEEGEGTGRKPDLLDLKFQILILTKKKFRRKKKKG